MNTLFVIITVLFVALFILLMVAYFKEKTLDEVRRDVYELFLRAEHKYTESGQGEIKMKWVIGRARRLLPVWLQVIMTEDVFERLIQVWFDGIKDLLDDGKLNGSNNG